MSVLTVENIFDAPVSKVWNALTNRNEMKKWYFDLKKFKPEVGFEFRFWGGPENGTQYLHICEITDVEPLKVLAYNWRYDGFPGNTNVRFVISVTNDSTAKTKVQLFHSGLETFPANNPDFAHKNFEEGWKYIIGTSLKNYLEH